MKLLSVWKIAKPSFEIQPAQKLKVKKGKENSFVLQNVERFLSTHYDFRYNVLREVTEYRQKEWGKNVFLTVLPGNPSLSKDPENLPETFVFA